MSVKFIVMEQKSTILTLYQPFDIFNVFVSISIGIYILKKNT